MLRSFLPWHNLNFMEIKFYEVYTLLSKRRFILNTPCTYEFRLSLNFLNHPLLSGWFENNFWINCLSSNHYSMRHDFVFVQEYEPVSAEHCLFEKLFSADPVVFNCRTFETSGLGYSFFVLVFSTYKVLMLLFFYQCKFYHDRRMFRYQNQRNSETDSINYLPPGSKINPNPQLL